ncbi:MAG: ABC transporter permease [Janthinobacterium lividum]
MLFRLAWKSLRSRGVITGLTVFSIALSILLLAGVDTLRNGARAGFAGTLSHTDLVVGARGGDLPLVLSTVFHIGSAANNMSWETYQHFAHHAAVAWTIPISLGDSFHGYRVVATDENFYVHYQYRGGHALAFASGHLPQDVLQVALGAEVAKALKLRDGDKLTLAHGVEAHSILNHDAVPFTVSGVLQPTATPVDRALYITLLGEEAMHFGWTDGTPPALGEDVPKLDPSQLKVDQITAFLVGAKSRISTLYLQREIATYKPEPLTAAIPAYTLQQLWALLDYADAALSLVAATVVVVGLFAMVAALYSALHERRHEIAILRAVGLHMRQVVLLFVMEATLIAVAGCVAGLGMLYLLLFTLRSTIESAAGIPLLIAPPSPRVVLYLLGTVVGAALLGLLPAWRAYRNSLLDGLHAS